MMPVKTFSDAYAYGSQPLLIKMIYFLLMFFHLLGVTVDCMYSTFGLLRDSSNLPRLGPYGMFIVQLGRDCMACIMAM